MPDDPQHARNAAPRGIASRPVVLGLLFASGFTGLVYQVLWLRELGLFLGNTAHAAATTLSAFFLGLAVGSRAWGRRSERMRFPLRAYGLLELGVAGSALLVLALLPVLHAMHGPLRGMGPLLLVAKVLLATLVLFPPAFFMGGTLPVLAQHFVREDEGLGRTGTILYAVNTLGAALGAHAAGFHLPHALGFRGAYFVTIVATVLVAVVAWALGGREPAREEADTEEEEGAPSVADDSSSARLLGGLAFLSGFVALGLEVLWTRMLAQVLQNSVYTFSIILVMFLIVLAAGAAVAHVLARRDASVTTLGIVVLFAGLLVGVSPFVFHGMTDGLAYVGGSAGWAGYVLQVHALAAAVMVPPGVLLGAVFPLLLKLAEPMRWEAGPAVGRLAFANTVGAIVGSLCAGFLLLELIGLWSSVRLLAALYVVAALLISGTAAPVLRWGAVAVLIALLTVLDSSRLPKVQVDYVRRGETVVDLMEGSAATVAVVRAERSLRIKVDNYYTLGGTGARKWEEWQSHLPLLMHPRPRSVFFLGLGTGITAGAALVHPVDRVVACELVPEAVEASRRYYGPYLNGLFSDDRAVVIVEDGRNLLRSTDESFDVIVADLFVPWRAGVGSVYSEEHFRTARDRLAPGGLFVQWLPLYQLAGEEVGTIARTLLEVFPLVTVWRGDFFGDRSILAFVGHEENAPISLSGLHDRFAELRDCAVDPESFPLARLGEGWLDEPETLLAFHVGNLTLVRDLFADYPLNTDDRPVIEMRAPITHRRVKAGQSAWMAGQELVAFFEELGAAHESDPYLADVGRLGQERVRQGLALHRSEIGPAPDAVEGAP